MATLEKKSSDILEGKEGSEDASAAVADLHPSRARKLLLGTVRQNQKMIFNSLYFNYCLISIYAINHLLTGIQVTGDLILCKCCTQTGCGIFQDFKFIFIMIAHSLPYYV